MVLSLDKLVSKFRVLELFADVLLREGSMAIGEISEMFGDIIKKSLYDPL